MRRTTLRPSAHQAIEPLRIDIEAGLRDLLREHRRRLAEPDYDAADAEETKIKELQRKLKLFEDVLKTIPPDEALLHIFEVLLRELQQAIDDFEDKLHHLTAAEQHQDPEGPSPPSQRLLTLLRSFEDVLHGSAALLRSLEDLLHRLNPPPLVLLYRFERLLKKFTRSIKSFEDLLHGQPFFTPGDALAFNQSFLALVGELEKLLLSFEALIKSGTPTEAGLAESFSELLGSPLGESLGELLESLAKLIQDQVHLEPDGTLTPADERLLKDFETLLHGYEDLLASFAVLVREHAAKRPALLKDFQGQLAELEARLDDFESMIKKFAPQKKPLIESFEDLLHGLVKLLTTFHQILKATDKKNTDRIEGFESLIRGFEERLDSFEDILKALPAPDVDLTLSFEKLLHDLADLLEQFEERKNGADFPNPDRVARSQEDLNGRYQKLQRSMEALKERFPTIPEELQKSDIKTGDDMLARLDVFARQLRRASPTATREFLTAIAYGARTLIALSEVLLRQRPVSRAVARSCRAVAARQRRLIDKTRAAVSHDARSSVFLQDALDDVTWLQDQLDARISQLRR